MANTSKMGTQKMIIFIFLFLFGSIGQEMFCLGVQETNSDRIMTKRQSGGQLNLEHLAVVGQRPTQFIANSQNQQQQQQQAMHTRGGLIMPANNQFHANSFHLQSSLDHPAAVVKHQAGVTNVILTPTSTSEPILRQGTQISNRVLSFEKLSHQQANGNNQGQKQQQQQIGNQVDHHHQQQVHSNTMELALRQVNGDESVFQPLSTIGTLSNSNINSFDWTPTQHSAQTYHGEPIKQEDQNALSKIQTQLAPAITTTTTTTEQSNNIAQSNDPASTFSSAIESTAAQLPDIQSQPANPSIEYPSLQFMSGGSSQSSSIQSQQANLNQSELLNNRVYYEGPATAPPTPPDYFFSSSEKLPNSPERSPNAWWALGFGHHYERASNLTRDDYLDYCSSTELLVSNKQRSICKSHPMIIPIVARGLRMAIDECQFRFTSNRWNCSLVLSESLNEHQSPFGDVMKHPIRERSFLNAIVAAGLAHAMTKACSQGELPEECSCDKKIRSRSSKGKIEWVACSDDIDFGNRFSRDFTDTNDNNESDISSMINQHNYEVGRRVFKSSTDITCSCQNGENGLCQTKRCWKHLGPFTDIGDELMKRYESATHVQLSSKDPHKLRPVRRGVRKPKRKDLVYIDESPDYCNPDIRLGVLGTQNRRCNSTNLGQDSCSLLCCGRGYQVVVEEVEEECNCKFVWCCQVKCDKCKRQVTNDVCN